MAERERYDDMGPATTLADAHAHWHAVHGKYAICDLDCGASEGLYAEDEQSYHEADPEYQATVMFVGEPDEPVYDEPDYYYAMDTEHGIDFDDGIPF